MITVYGLKNCDTCRRAKAWLVEQGITYRFVDMRKDGPGDVETWLGELGQGTLINRRGTTWRTLPEDEKTDLDDCRAAALIRAWPALVKRPVFDLGNRVLAGFSAASKSALRAAGKEGDPC